MRLGDFILSNSNTILAEWDVFARQIWPVEGPAPRALRDHGEEILIAVARDMQSAQTAKQQTQKSQGVGGPSKSGSILDAASLDHAQRRATSGFSLPEVLAEYRALRASVLRLWSETIPPPDQHDFADLTRFNEAIDQALAEAVRGYTQQIEDARQTFLAILGHDLRNPLNAMVVSAEVLADDLGRGSESAAVAAQIIASGDAMSGMLADFLDFAQTKLGKAIPVTRVTMDVAPLCNAVIQEIQAAHPEMNICLITRGDLTGEWDSARIRQMLSNLVGNAVQHGAVDRAIEVVAAEAGDDVLFTIRNEGAAIPENLLPRIFEPMTRGSSAETRKSVPTGSMGLGLYIAREVATAHDGEIRVESTAAKTTFSVQLPRRAPLQTGVSQRSAPSLANAR
jgi:signal transduction histidine kinase